MQIDVYIINPGVDAVIDPAGLDVTTDDGLDVLVVDNAVETPTGELLECVEGLDGPAGKPARVDVPLSWSGQLRPGEALPGVPIPFPARFDDAACWGYARTPATADTVMTICNRDPMTVIGTVTWPAGQHVPVIALTGGSYAAARGDFLFLVGSAGVDATLADAGLTLAGDTVQ